MKPPGARFLSILSAAWSLALPSTTAVLPEPEPVALPAQAQRAELPEPLMPRAAATKPPGAVLAKLVQPAPDGRRYGELVQRAARLYHVSARLLHAVIMVESSYRADAVSPVGAAGLMQLMPQTAARYGVGDLFDPAANIAAGAQHLSWLLERFDNDLTLALAAYNAGEGAVLRHGGVPPYPETERYVARVLEYYARMP